MATAGTLLRSMLFALGLITALTALFYRLVGLLRPRKPTSDAKREPYACGQDMAPAGERLSYQRFYRLALVYLVVHIAALIAILLPLAGSAVWLALIYLIGIFVCVDILTHGEG